MRLTRSGSDPIAFPAQSCRQQCKSFLPSKGNAMRHRPHTDRTQRSWIDQLSGSKGCATDRFDSTGRTHAVVCADLDGPDVNTASEHSHPRPSWNDPRAATGTSSGWAIGQGGFGPLRNEAVGGPARTSQTRAGRPPHHFAVMIYRALFLATLGCTGFGMFWLVLHLGSH
jgi:hypothetical protein